MKLNVDRPEFLETDALESEEDGCKTICAIDFFPKNLKEIRRLRFTYNVKEMQSQLNIVYE